MNARPGEELASGWRFRFADAAWQPVEVPHTWNAHDTMSTDPTFHYRRGVGTYELDFTPPAGAEGRRLWLRFGAVAQRGRVYFDDVCLAEHHGGYTAFTVEVPNRSGLLRVEADNTPDPDLIPSDLSDFYLYGGITRPVICYHTGPVRLDRLLIDSDTTPDRVALALRACFDGAVDAPLTLEVGLYDDRQEHPIFTERLRVDAAELAADLPDVANPRLWSPAAPRLYHLRARLLHADTVLDVYETALGFRWFDFPAGGPFVLNGERLLLRGTHRHDDWADHGAAVPADLVVREMQAVKAAGFNFIRLGHYPQDDLVLRLCDELGLIVWEELPWCRGGVGGTVFRDHARAMLTEMIAQHYNHPSVIFWGLGNELDWESEHPDSTDEQVADFLRELHTLSHSLDPRRLTALRRFDRGAAIVDVYSPSIWSGWYRGRYADYEVALRRNMARYPRMLHIEWGGDSHMGRHNDGPHINVAVETGYDHGEVPGTAISDEGFARYSRDGDWSESYTIDLMAHHLTVQARQPELAGTAQWIFKDFGTPLRPENPVPYVNQKGLVARDGTPKDVYHVFRAFQRDEPVVHIESSAWPLRVGGMVRVITNCERVKLLVDGQSQGIRLRDNPGAPAEVMTWNVPLSAGEHILKAIGYRGDCRCARHEITQAVVAGDVGPVAGAAIQRESEAAALRLVVQLTDAAGRPVIADERRVHFRALSGGAVRRWQGVMGGCDVVETANGRAYVDLMPDAGTTMRVQVTVEGLAPVDVTIDDAAQGANV
ncbi:MAG: glycoside hydrolase family 2 protein [Phototrophicaceae bacterium]